MHLVWLAISILLGALGQVCFKLGVTPGATTSLSPAFIVELVKSPWIWVGGLCYGASFVLWLFILKFFPLGLARPLTSIGYIATYLLAVIVIGESFSFLRLAGILLIVAGVIITAL
jgi:multidrug transporter EmrE-like cation transporter